MIYHTDTDLYALLDSLTDGEHIKATWVYDQRTVTVEGPVYKNDLYCSCFQTIRRTDGSIESALASFEVTRDEDVTATRDDDEEALHALLDSLEGGETITAEWRNESGTMALAGQATPNDAQVVVSGLLSFALRWGDGILHRSLRSVTVRRTVEQRWEREDDESSDGAR